MIPKQRSKPGFVTASVLSLIEVLVAFVILSMVMSVILRINATSLRNHDVSGDYARAVQIAQSRMTELGVEQQSASFIRDGHEPGGISWRFVRQPYGEWSELQQQSIPVEPVEEQITISWGGEDESPRTLSFSRVNLIKASR